LGKAAPKKLGGTAPTKKMPHVLLLTRKSDHACYKRNGGDGVLRNRTQNEKKIVCFVQDKAAKSLAKQNKKKW